MITRQRIAFSTCRSLRLPGGGKARARSLDRAPQGGQVGQGALRLARLRETGRSLVPFGGMSVDLAVNRREPGGNRGGLGAQPLVCGAGLLEPSLGFGSGGTRLLAGSRRRSIGTFSRVQSSPGERRFPLGCFEIAMQ